MVVSYGCFVVNDALIKALGNELPASQTVFIRGVFAACWVMLALLATGVRLRPSEHVGRAIVARGVLDCLATFAYIASLLHMPLGNAISINMAAPLMVTALAVLMLGERVDGLRWAAIVVGFGGVLLLVRPSAEGFNAWALLCLLATLMHSVRDLVTRRIDRQVPSLVVTLVTALTIVVVSGAACAVLPWEPVSLRALGLLAAASVFLFGGYFFVILSTRVGQLSAVAPFRYSGLPIGLFIGWVVWGEVPDAPGWIGIVLLIGAGLYLLYRERVLKRSEDSSNQSSAPSDAS